MSEERMFLKVTLEVEGFDPTPMLVDVTVFDIGYEVNKMVFWQVNLKTGKGAWVVFPKQYYPARLKMMKKELDDEISRIKNDPGYTGERYERILKETKKEMILQDEGSGHAPC